MWWDTVLTVTTADAEAGGLEGSALLCDGILRPPGSAPAAWRDLAAAVQLMEMETCAKAPLVYICQGEG